MSSGAPTALPNQIYALSLDGANFRYVGLASRKHGGAGRLRDHKIDAANGDRGPLLGWMRKHGPENVVISIL